MFHTFRWQSLGRHSAISLKLLGAEADGFAMANSEGPACQTCLEEVDLKLSRLSLRHSRKLKIVVAEQVCVCVCAEHELSIVV